MGRAVAQARAGLTDGDDRSVPGSAGTGLSDGQPPGGTGSSGGRPPAGRTGAGLLTARTGWSAAALLPLAFLALFFAWPVLAILTLGLREGGVLDAVFAAETWELVGF